MDELTKSDVKTLKTFGDYELIRVLFTESKEFKGETYYVISYKREVEFKEKDYDKILQIWDKIYTREARKLINSMLEFFAGSSKDVLILELSSALKSVEYGRMVNEGGCKGIHYECCDCGAWKDKPHEVDCQVGNALNMVKCMAVSGF